MLLCGTAKATEINYSALTISEELKKNADAVVRHDKIEFIVLSKAKAIKRTHFVVTILNKNARDHATIAVHYNQLSKVKSLEGKVYNAFGGEIRKLKRKEIQDMSVYDGASLFSDHRIKVASLEHNNYPFTVEWIYEEEEENLMFYPGWVAQGGEKLAVEESEMIIEMPLGMKLRYHGNSLAPACEIKTHPGKTTYHWKTGNLPAIRPEPLGPPFSKLVPLVYTAPDEFEVAGYAGRMDSWENYGKFITLLNSSRNDLPPAAVEKVKQLTKDLPDRRDKIKAVYDYLQSNTRYVGIQLGIGGWQPFKTSFVFDKGYGDCKALSFYTKSLLEAIDIPSWYTLISAGNYKPEVREDFPRSSFNHAILCVPNGQDTIWLECTSQTNPFGYLGNFTSDRKAVIITEEGGKIVKTPAYHKEDNLQNTVAHVKLTGGTSAEVDFVRTYEGLQFENYNLHHYINLGREEQRKWIYKAVNIPSYEITDFSFSLEEKMVPVATLKSGMLIRNFTTSSGKRTFISLNLANQLKTEYPALADRKTEFETGVAFIDTDTIVYHLPAGATTEYLMEDVEIKTEFGEYKAMARQEGPKITYTRIHKQNAGKYGPEKYNDYITFRQEISRVDNARAVILNP